VAAGQKVNGPAVVDGLTLSAGKTLTPCTLQAKTVHPNLGTIAPVLTIGTPQNPYPVHIKHLVDDAQPKTEGPLHVTVPPAKIDPSTLVGVLTSTLVGLLTSTLVGLLTSTLVGLLTSTLVGLLAGTVTSSIATRLLPMDTIMILPATIRIKVRSAQGELHRLPIDGGAMEDHAHLAGTRTEGTGYGRSRFG
jgi:hypothetical protein